jgi:tetratricopeptide (TPR) repeat protein
MKKVLIGLSLLSMVLGFTAFDCSSAELTGAKLYINQKQYDKAKEALQKDVEKNPASDEGWWLLGYLDGEQGNFKDMFTAFDKSLAISKKFETQITEYKRWAWQSSFNKGVSFFNQAVKSPKPDSMKILFGKAVEQFVNSTICQPDSSIGYENAAAVYMNLNDYDGAIPYWEKLTKIGKPSNSFARLGQIYMVKGAGLMDTFKASKDKADSIKAADWYAKALIVLKSGNDKFPGDSDILLQLGNAYYISNQLDVAISSFKILVDKNPENKELKYALGVVLLKAQKYQESTAQLEAVLKMDANYTDALYNLSAAYINWGNDLRDVAVKKESTDKSYEDKFRLAVPLLEKYLTIKPNEPRIWISLGQVYALLGQAEKSSAAFKKADEYK